MTIVFKNFNKGGYDKVTNILNRIFNFILAAILLIPSFPLIVMIAILIKFSDNGPILYKGERLGLNKKVFIMYKFRTLISGAEEIIGANLLDRRLTEHKKLETSIGTFLRDTRLDELPQLINVLLGKMDMVGPRPVRPIIYERFCKNIKGYDKRFHVRPGLIGYSQLFTPHGTPKRIRAYIDYIFLKKKQILFWDIFFCFYAFIMLSLKGLKSISRFFLNFLIKEKLFRRYKQKRLRERRRLENAYAFLETNEKRIGRIIDINEEAVLIRSKDAFRPTETIFPVRFEVITKKFGSPKKRVAHCKGKIYRKMEIPDDLNRYRYVLDYEPISPFNGYLISQYFLSDSAVF